MYGNKAVNSYLTPLHLLGYTVYGWVPRGTKYKERLIAESLWGKKKIPSLSKYNVHFKFQSTKHLNTAVANVHKCKSTVAYRHHAGLLSVIFKYKLTNKTNNKMFTKIDEHTKIGHLNKWQN